MIGYYGKGEKGDLVEKLKKRGRSEDPGLDGRMILK
jgi:hypothetical protein